MAEENNHTHDLELIESFLDGDLEGEALTSFEGRRSSDAHFKELVDQEMLLRKGIEFSALSDAFDSIQQAELRDNKKQINFPRRWLLVAASIAVVALATIVILNQSNTPEHLFAQNFEPYPNSFVKETRDSEADLKVKAFIAYDNQNYQQAITYFNQYISENEDAVSLFFLGNAYLANNNFDAAILTFEDYLNKYDAFSEEANWYLLLAYLGVKKEEKVLSMSNDKDKFGPYSSKVKKIELTLEKNTE